MVTTVARISWCTLLFSKSISINIVRSAIGVRSLTLLFLQISLLSLVKCSAPWRLSNSLLEMSIIFKLWRDLQTIGSRFVSLFWLRLSSSKVCGSYHIYYILLLDKLSFLRNGNFCNSFISFYKRFPLTSSSVKFLNFSISFISLT